MNVSLWLGPRTERTKSDAKVRGERKMWQSNSPVHFLRAFDTHDRQFWLVLSFSKLSVNITTQRSFAFLHNRLFAWLRCVTMQYVTSFEDRPVSHQQRFAAWMRHLSSFWLMTAFWHVEKYYSIGQCRISPTFEEAFIPLKVTNTELLSLKDLVSRAELEPGGLRER